MNFNFQETEKIIEKLIKEKLVPLLSSDEMVENICKEINSPFNFALGLDHIVASSYTRSFSSSLGTNLQSASAEIAKIHGWKIINDSKTLNDGKVAIHGYYSDETRIVIDEIMSYIEKCNQKNPLTFQYLEVAKTKILDKVLTTRGQETIRYADLPLMKEENGIMTIANIETKSGGDLDKGKAHSQRRESLELFALIASKYKDKVLNRTLNLEIYFATLYNKTELLDGAKNWKSSSVRKNFIKEELLIGSDFWNYICNNQEAYKNVVSLYIKHSHNVKDEIEKLKDKVKPKLIGKITDYKDFYSNLTI